MTNILIVEDVRIIAKGIEHRLRGLGYDVVASVATGEEAVQKAYVLRPNLVLMDIRLGGRIDGVEAADLVRKMVDVPVVFLTGYSNQATLERAKLAEPHGYVLKPFEDKELQSAIEIGLYRHKIDRLRRESEHWLAATLGNIADAVITTDQEGRVRFMNSVAERLTGWSLSVTLNVDVRDILNIVSEHTHQPAPNPVMESLAKGLPITSTSNAILIDREGNKRRIDTSSTPIRDVNRHVSGAVLVIRETTECPRTAGHLR